MCPSVICWCNQIVDRGGLPYETMCFAGEPPPWRDEAFGRALRSRVEKGIAVLELFDGVPLRLRSHKAGFPTSGLKTAGCPRRL